MKIYYSILALAAPMLATACSSDDPEPLPDLTPQVELCEINNGGFEQNLDGWSVGGDAAAAKISTSACEGNRALVLGSSDAHTVSVSQTASNIADGLYDLEFFYKNTGTGQACYITAGSNSKMTALADDAQQANVRERGEMQRATQRNATPLSLSEKGAFNDYLAGIH